MNVSLFNFAPPQICLAPILAFSAHQRRCRWYRRFKTKREAMSRPPLKERTVEASYELLQPLLGLLQHRGVQTVAVGVHGDHRGEILHPEGPDGLGAAELFQVHAQDLGHALGENLGRAADGVRSEER